MTSSLFPRTDATEWPERRFAVPDAAVRLYCFPFAGGSAAFYHSWADRFLSGVELVPVQLPGRGALLGRPCLRTIEAIADAITPVIARDPGPVALFGHSMGAIVAFETARRLRAAGRQPVHLFVSGRPGPRIRRPVEPVSHLPREQFVAMLRDYGAADQEILEHQELLDVLIPMMRSDFHAIETYRYRPGAPLTCPISAWAGAGDTEAPGSVMATWQAETEGPFVLEELPGGHFFLTGHRDRIVTAIHERLAAAAKR